MFNPVKTTSVIQNLKSGVALGVVGLMAALPSSAQAQYAWDNITQDGGNASVGTSTATVGSDFNTTLTFNSGDTFSGTAPSLNINTDQNVHVSGGRLFVAKDLQADPTQLLGGLSSDTATIYVLNKNGVYFGASSRIDAAGIVAAAAGQADLSAFDTVTGTVTLSDFGTGSVTNDSVNFNVTGSVYGSGLAAFVAPTVINNGIITAKMGRVHLASGGSVATVDMYGDGLYEIALSGPLGDAYIENSGTIDVAADDIGTPGDGGTIALTARAAAAVIDNVINMSGDLVANSVTMDGGKIVLDGGTSGIVNVAGSVDATGTTADGNINVLADVVDLDADLASDDVTGSVATVNVVGSTNGAEIQDAVDIAAADATVNVGAGTYAESIHIDKEISIHGAGRNQTFITPGAGQDGFYVNSDLGAGSRVLLRRMDVSGGRNGVHFYGNASARSLVLGGMSFSGNSQNGVRVHSGTEVDLDNFIIRNSVFNANGADMNTATSLGFGDILAFKYNGNVEFTNLDINGYATGGANFGIQLRGTDTPAPAGTIEFNNVNISGSYRRPNSNYGTWSQGGPGAGIAMFTYSDTSNVSFTDVVLDLTEGHGMQLDGLGDGTTELNIGNTFFNDRDYATLIGGLNGSLALPSQAIFVGTSGLNPVTTNVDARNATFDGAANNFEIEDRVSHLMDNAALGRVTWVEGSLYVSQNSLGIQHAVDFANVGDDIFVADGTFSGGINITKSVSLFGTGYSNTTFISVPAFGAGMTVFADNVTVDGFGFEFAGIGSSGAGVFVDGASNTTLSNNGYFNLTYGVLLENSNTTEISNSLFEGFGSDAIHADNADNLTVLSSTFDLTADGDTAIFTGAGSNNLTVTGSTFNGGFYALDLNGEGVVNVSESFIQGQDADAIKVRVSSNHSDVNINNNSILSADDDAIDNDHTTLVVNASGNWWGVDPLGNGRTDDQLVADMVEGAVDITPMLVSGTDTDLLTPGFQGDFTTLFVTALESQTGSAGRIQEGVDLVTNSTVYVGAGTFYDNVVVDKFVNLIGMQDGVDARTRSGGLETIVQADLSSNLDSQLTNSVFTFEDDSDGSTLDGFTVNGFVSRNGTLRGSVRVETGADNLNVLNNIITTDVNATATQENMPNELWVEGDNATVQYNKIVRSAAALAQSNNGAGTSNGNPAMRFGGVDGATVQYNSVDGGAIAASGASGTLLIDQNTVQNAADHAIWASGGSADVTVSSNTLAGSNGSGILVQNNTGGTVQIDGNAIGDSSDGVVDGVSVKNNTGANTITNNSVFGNSNIGIEVLNTDGTEVEGNTVDNFLVGIKLEDSAQAKAIDNDVSDSATGILVDNSANAWVYDNDITGSSTAGVHIKDTNMSNYGGGANGDVDVWRNRIVSAASATGILVENSNYTTIGAHDNNVFGPDGLPMGNVISGGVDGVVISDSNTVMVRYNTISGVSDNGIEVQSGTAADAQILDNDLDNIGANGISTQGNGHLISRNDVNTAGASGIISSFGDSLTITDNVVTGADDNGIVVQDVTGTNLVDGNTINDAVDTGIVAVRAAGTTVSNNTIGDVTGVGGQGVRANDSAGIVVDTNTIDSTGADGIEVTDSAGSFVQNNLVGTNGGTDNIGAEGIDVNNSANTSITGNTVTETVSNGISLNPSSGSVVQGNTISNVGAHGIYTTGSNNLQIGGFGLGEDNSITNAALHGIFVESGTNNRVDNNTVITTGENGIFLSGSTASFVTGNDVDAAGNNGIAVVDSANAQVTNNDVTDTFAAGIALNRSGNSTVDGNDIDDTDGSGIWVNDSSGSTISANTLDNVGDGSRPTDDGIHVKASSNMTIGGATLAEGNSIAVTNGNGIYLTGGTGNVVQHNSVSDAGENGIYVDGSNGVQVFDNDIVVAGQDGILIENSDNAELWYNYTTDTESNGIHVVSSEDVEVFENEVEAALLDGIFADNATGIAIEDNDVTDVSGNGIRVFQSDTAEITLNEVSETDENGIFVSESEDVFVELNDVDAAGNNGIAVVDSAGAEIFDNDVTDTFAAGIALNRSGNSTVDGNDIDDTDGSGIWVNDSSGSTVSGNEIDNAGDGSRPTDDGIHVVASSTVTVDDNDIDTTNGNGIYLTGGTDNDITNNDVVNATENGIYVDGSNGADVMGNSITTSGLNGILVNPSHDVTISGNDITGATVDGIQVLDSDRVTIEDNDIFGTSSGFLGFPPAAVNGAGRDGIHLSGGVDGVINNNRVTGDAGFLAGPGLGAERDGIHVENNNGVEITNNDILGETDVPSANAVDGEGIFVSGSNDILVDGNEVFRVGLNGIHVTNGSGAILQFNEIENTGGNGIEVLSNIDAQVLNNEVVDSGEHGIDVRNSGNAQVNNNDVFDTGIDGISFVGNGTSSEIVGNTIGDTDDDGIHVVDSAGVLIDDNDIGANNTRNGIQTFFLGSTAEPIGSEGIRVESSENAVITNNDIRNTEDNGVYVSGSNSTLIEDNTFNNVDENGVLVDASNDVTINANDIFELGNGAGPSTNGVDGNGFEVNGGNNVTITNNTIGADGTDGHGIQVNDNTGTVTITGNVFDGAGLSDPATGGDGIQVNRSSNFVIQANTLDDIGNNGIYVFESGIGGTAFIGGATSLLGNTISDTGANGIYNAGSNGTLIANNTISGAGQNGVLINPSDDVVVDGNTISGVSDDGIRVEGGNNFTASGNTVSDTGANGVTVIDTTGLTSIVNNFIGTDSLGANLGDGNIGDDGIFADGVETLTVSGNTISDTDADGVKVESGTGPITISDNYIGTTSTGADKGNDNIGEEGIDVEDVTSTVTISGNTVVDTDSEGMEISRISGAVDISNNFIGTNAAGADFDSDNIDNEGIEVDSLASTLTISGNTIVDTGLDGIEIDGVTGLTTITNNFVGTNAAGTDFGDDNIDNEGMSIATVSAVTISGNTIVDTGEEGVEIDVATGLVSISGNYIGTNAAGGDFGDDNIDEDGIDVFDVAALTMTGNTIVDTGNTGVKVDLVSGLVSISNNFIGTNAANADFGSGTIDDEGMDLDNLVNASITGNTVVNAGREGIEIDDVTGSATLTNNTVTENGEDGLSAEDVVNLTVTGGTYSDNGENGIELDDVTGFATLTNNTVTGNTEDGVNADNVANLTVTGGTYSDNGDTGIYVADSSDVTIDGTTSNDNGENGIALIDVIGALVTDVTSTGNTEAGLFIDPSDDITVELSTFDGNNDGVVVENSTNILFDTNSMSDNTATGVTLSGVDSVTLLNNTIDNNDQGVLASVFFSSNVENGLITLEGNTFTDNSTGARFESGEIDLSSADNPNVFTGGVNGLEFSPALVQGLQGLEEAELTLVDDTLGFTTFTGQSGFYVELSDGAFFDEATSTETIINGIFATFDGVTAGPDGILTQAELDAIEAQIQDFDDLATLGQIFVGAVSPFDNFEDLLNQFGGLSNTTGVNLTVAGSVPVSEAALLNALAPAAGDGEEDGSDLQDIEPAAGPDGQVGCFSDMAGKVGTTVVNYSYSDNGTFGSQLALMNDAANCGVSSEAQ